MAKRRSELDRLIERMLRRHGRGADPLARILNELEFRTHPDALLRALLRGSLSAKPKPPKPRKRRPDEGGEPAPVKPRPKPKPLTGGAAAPIERNIRRKSVSKAVGERMARTRVPADSRSSQIL